jgi:hypothetical protein
MFRLITSVAVVIVVVLLYAFAAKLDNNSTESQPSTPRSTEFSNDAFNSMRSN